MHSVSINFAAHNSNMPLPIPSSLRTRINSKRRQFKKPQKRTFKESM